MANATVRPTRAPAPAPPPQHSSPVPLPLHLGLLAGVASGVLLWLASPAVGLGWLAWVALVPAAAAGLRGATARAGRLAVPLAYAVYLELSLVPAFPAGLADRKWGDPAVPILVRGSPALAIALVGVPLVGALLYAIRFPFLGTAGRRLPLAAALLVPAAAWTSWDLLRVKLDPSGYWGPLFLSQHDLPTARLAALGGPWLLTLALVAFGVALAHALVAGRLRPAAAGGGIALAAAAVVAVVALAYPAGDAEPVRVAVVQPGFNTAAFERPVLRHFRGDTRDDERASLDLLRDLGSLTHAAARAGAELVVWPEAVLWVDPREPGPVRRELEALAADAGVVLVAPYFLRGPAAGAALVALPDGSLGGQQPKQRPMWFLGEAGGDTAARSLDSAVGPLGALLGVDNEDSASARALVRAGARLLVASSHDWQEFSSQQRAFAQLHAAALARPVLKADWRWGSAVYAAGGAPVADAGIEQRRVALVADVAPRAGRTPYAVLGDALGWAAVAVALGAPLALLRRRATAG